MKKPLALLGVSAVVGLGIFAMSGTANAEVVGAWKANGASSVDGDHQVTLRGDNTSVEIDNLDQTVAVGDVITFNYTLSDGAECVGGAPRVFVIVDGHNDNSWDQNIGAGTQCGVAGLVTFHATQAGTIGNAGVVYDNSKNGTVVVNDLVIDGKKVDFDGVTVSPSPTTASPSPSESESGTPTPSESQSTSPAPTKSNTSTALPTKVSTSPAAGLPVTGDKGPSKFVVIGAAALVLGAAGIVIARKRRDTNFVAE